MTERTPLVLPEQQPTQADDLGRLVRAASRAGNRPEHPCRGRSSDHELNRSVLSYLAQTPSVEVVALSSPFVQYTNPGTAGLTVTGGGAGAAPFGVTVALEAMRATLAELRSLGKRVVVVAPPPTGTFDLGLCAERMDAQVLVPGPHRGCRLPLAEFHEAQKYTREFLRQLRLNGDAVVIDFERELCSETGCDTLVDGTLIYRDTGHLSYEGSLLVAKRSNLAARILELARSATRS